MNKIFYINLGLIFSGASYGGYRLRRDCTNDYKKRGYINIPNKILIPPTIVGTIAGGAAYPLMNIVMVFDMIYSGVEKYIKWVDDELKKSNNK